MSLEGKRLEWGWWKIQKPRVTVLSLGQLSSRLAIGLSGFKLVFDMNSQTVMDEHVWNILCHIYCFRNSRLPFEKNKIYLGMNETSVYF